MTETINGVYMIIPCAIVFTALIYQSVVNIADALNTEDDDDEPKIKRTRR
jgi:hypothetical protein